MAKFELGDVIITPGAAAAFIQRQIDACLRRHAEGDWGDVDDDEWALNDEAAANDDRMVSEYVIDGKRLRIVTASDKSVTTVLSPSEY